MHCFRVPMQDTTPGMDFLKESIEGRPLASPGGFAKGCPADFTKDSLKHLPRDSSHTEDFPKISLTISLQGLAKNFPKDFLRDFAKGISPGMFHSRACT